MKNYEDMLLIHFLGLLYNKMGVAGCNDFSLEQFKLSTEEKKDLLDNYANYMIRTGGWRALEVSELTEWKMEDFCVVGMLADRIKIELR